MNNSAYWKKRFEAIESSAVSKGASYYSTLEKQYLEASKRIEQEISTWYQRFAVNNEISLAEARKLLNSGELKEFKWTVQDYIKHGELNSIDASWMKQLENASAKVHISRLEALKIQMQQQVEVLYGNQVDDIDKLAKRIYSDTYYHTAYEIQKGFKVGWDLPSFNDRQLEKVLSKPWTSDNMTFRDKCWKRKDELVATVQTQLTQGILRGDSPDKAIKAISDKFKVDKSKAGRLVMTESAYFAADAQKKCFTDLDVDKVEIVATLDSHTSELCQEMDGKIVDMKDYEPGVTVPPFHPWCRSTTVPYFPDNYGERAARNKKGETYYVPSDMKYGDWKKSFVGGTPESHGTAKASTKTESKPTVSDEVQKVIDKLNSKGIEYKDVQKYAEIPSETDIIEAISGGDRTEGSCASVALAYAGQKQGLNVLDFRDGASRDWFSGKLNKVEMFKSLGVDSITEMGAKSNLTNGKNILSRLELDKQYYLSVGRHAAIVRKVERDIIDWDTLEITGKQEVLQYLELQQGSGNGWKNFAKDVRDTLKQRFGCSSSSMRYQAAYATDISQLKGTDFETILGYINTAIDAQVKGVNGYAK